jgi:hypothetical protein
MKLLSKPDTCSLAAAGVCCALAAAENTAQQTTTPAQITILQAIFRINPHASPRIQPNISVL